MKKLIKYGMNLLTGLLLASCLLLQASPIPNVQAAVSYVLTYRAGNVGTFSTEGWSNLLQQKGYADGTYEVTENYIKITVARGADAPVFGQTEWNANTTLSDPEKYFILDATTFGPGETDTVSHNEEYVVDYGVLVNPVLYTVIFVDSTSGTEVAAPVIAYGNAGDEIVCSPIGISGYTNDEADETITLSASQENKVAFHYVSETTTETVVNTITETQTVTTTQAGDSTAAAANNATGNTANNATDNAADNTANNAADNAGQDAATDPAATTITDEEVPLADAPQEQNAGTDTSSTEDSVTIDDEEVPLADAGSMGLQEKKINPYLMAGILVFGIATIGTVVFLRIRKIKK